MSLAFTVLGEPRGKGRPKFASRGGHAVAYTDKATASYENLVAYTADQEMKKAGVGMFEGPLAVSISIWIKIPASASKKKQAAIDGTYCTRKPDVDNAVKIILDGLNGVAFADDVQVTRLVVEKRWSHRPRADVVVQLAEDMF